MTDDSETRSAGTLLTDALESLSRLVRGEVALARAEIEERFRNAGAAIGLIIAAAVFALTALNVLAAALVAGLVASGLATGWAALGVGIACALLALLLALKGAQAFNLSRRAPTRTARNLRRDAETLKEIVTNDPTH